MNTTKLTALEISLLRKAVVTFGNYNPDELMPYIEEELTGKQYTKLFNFLQWCHDNNKTFGANVKDIYKIYADVANKLTQPNATMETSNVIVGFEDANDFLKQLFPQYEPTQPFNADDVKNIINPVIADYLFNRKDLIQLLSQLSDRWQDEREYEDWSEYDKSIRKNFHFLNVVGTQKRPIGVKFYLFNVDYTFAILANKVKISAKVNQAALTAWQQASK